MALIFESKHFVVHSEDQPLVDRNDGGHVTINPKKKISTRQELSAKEAIELMRLTMVVGEAMGIVMTRHGVEIGRINYQDNGNWSVNKPGGPTLHIHLYGRAKRAIIQRYGEALHFPHKDIHPEFYLQLKPLSDADVSSMHSEINSLLQKENYLDTHWGL